MAYTPPSMVLSPKVNVSDLKVLFDGGEGGWSAAQFRWKDSAGNTSDAVGVRWNGDSDNNSRFPGIGNPQSRGVPTWFVLPDELAEFVKELAVKKDAEKKKITA